MSDRHRVGVLLAFFCVATAVLLVRLFSVSVIQHKSYVAKAQEQQTVERDILPRRGTVYVQDAAAQNDSVVAQSVERFALSVTPRNVTHKPEVAHLLSKISGVDEQYLLDIFNAKGWYMDPIMHGLTKEQVVSISEQISSLSQQLGDTSKDVKVNFDDAQGDIIYYLSGTMFLREYQRTYPEGPLMSQVVGFVNEKGEGQYGLEAHYDSELKGYAGRVVLEQDSTGQLLGQTGVINGQDGASYVLSIDRNVQYDVEKELAQEIKDSESKSGSVIIMDPKTGAIIAMASLPGFDPNNYAATAKDGHLDYFQNPQVSSMWEPGSIFKPLVMSAAIDMGLVTPDTRNTFGKSVTVDGHVINTALNVAYGDENMTDVLVNSDNVAMVWVANKLGNDNMYNYLKKFGFGTVTGVDVADEISGNLPSLDDWRNINRATISFGQGIGVTPIQVAAAYSAIANDGKLVQPHVVQTIIQPDGTHQEVQPVYGEQVIKPETAQKLRDMMTAVVVHNHTRAGVAGYKIAGKTGTAQVPDLQKGGYIADAYNHSFVGLLPADNPRFVMLVKLDQPNLKKVGTFAESTAVPLFGKIAQFLLDYYQVPPTNR